ncbi:MAG: hypothetical protein V3V00_12600 [Saprospiraceae bacterium]
MSSGTGDVTAYSAENKSGDGSWIVTNQSGMSYLLLQFNDGSERNFLLEWGEYKKVVFEWIQVLSHLGRCLCS